jgi:hypothetical protein
VSLAADSAWLFLLPLETSAAAQWFTVKGGISSLEIEHYLLLA